MDTVVKSAIVLFLIFVHEDAIDAEIYAYDSYNETHVFSDRTSSFGPEIEARGVLGILVRARPYNACSKLDRPPYGQNGEQNLTSVQIALITRGVCDFAIKVLNAQKAGYQAAIVHSVDSDMLVTMGSDEPYIVHQIYIPSVYIGLSAAKELNSTFLYQDKRSPCIQIFEGTVDPVRSYVIPFIVVLGVCTVFLLSFMLARWVRDRRRTRKNRLSLRRLKKLPVKKYDKGDEYDVCAICLDDYEEGDPLRILPCAHAYHCKCVDPWLTSNKRVCPLCKRRVLSDDEDESSSNENDDDTDEDEHTPLVPSSVAASPNAPMYATGYGSRNPFTRSRRQISNRRASTSSDYTSSTDASDVEILPERRFSSRNDVSGSERNEAPTTSGLQTQASQPQPWGATSELHVAVSAHPDVLPPFSEATRTGLSRLSTLPTAVSPVSDAQSFGSTPEAHSCSPQDFYSLDGSTTVVRSPLSPSPKMGASPDSGQEDVVVIARGSRTQTFGDGDEV